MGVNIVLALIYILSILTVYILTKRRYSTDINLTEVNSMLSEILEVNFKNNSLSNAAQSILIVLRRFYNTDYITILVYNDKTDHMSVVASNVGNHRIADVQDYCNTTNRTMGRNASKVNTSQGAPLSYPTASERNVYFSNFTPLKHKGKTIGGILLENTDTNKMVNSKERMHLYNKIFQSTALVLQNVIYTENLVAMTSTDQLTGIYNRRFIDVTLTEQLNIHRNLGLSMSVAIFDIDHFKKFNDTYGHPFGDIVLQEVAKFMKDNMPEDGWVARYGGEEFVLFFGRSHRSDVYRKIEQLRKGLSELKLTDGEVTTHVTASFGVVTYPDIEDSASGLIAKADQALYQAKESGRNRIRAFQQ